MGERPERAREQAGLLPNGDTGQINYFSRWARPFGGCVHLLDRPARSWEHKALTPPWVWAILGASSLGACFLICKVKEAARWCPLRVLSVPKVKVWVSWARGAYWYVWPWPTPYRADFGQH